MGVERRGETWREVERSGARESIEYRVSSICSSCTNHTQLSPPSPQPNQIKSNQINAQQPLIDSANRKLKNQMVKSKRTSGKFSTLKSELKAKEEQIQGLEAMVERLNAKGMASMKRLMMAWRNKSILTTFAAWKGWYQDEKSVKVRMRKFLMKMKSAGLAKCFMNWASFIDEVKRERVLIQRFAARWKNMCVYRTFAAWQKDYRDAKHQRELVAAGKAAEVTQQPVVDRAKDSEFLRGKGFLKHTNAFKNGDLNPLRVKELLGEVRGLKEENKHLRETIMNLKIAASARSLRSPSPTPRGNWKKNIDAMIAGQRFANMPSSPSP